MKSSELFLLIDIGINYYLLNGRKNNRKLLEKVSSFFAKYYKRQKINFLNLRRNCFTERKNEIKTVILNFVNF